VKELRLAGISTIEEANTFLLETYLPKINGKFSHPATCADDAHVPLGKTDLKDMMCFEYERTVSNDYVIRHECRLFQILKTGKPMPRPKDKVTVRVRLDGSYSIPSLRVKRFLLRSLRSRKRSKIPLRGLEKGTFLLVVGKMIKNS
jgi:hypothetical protein